jgi:hypothetical protein
LHEYTLGAGAAISRPLLMLPLLLFHLRTWAGAACCACARQLSP